MFLRKLFLIGILVIFTFSVLGYGIYKALPIILGPKIILNTPKNGDVVNGTSILVSGNVSRTSELYINNIPTAFTEEGNFATRLAVYPGSNIVILEAYDRFGRRTSSTLNVGTK